MWEFCFRDQKGLRKETEFGGVIVVDNGVFCGSLQVKYWVEQLATELAERLQRDQQQVCSPRRLTVMDRFSEFRGDCTKFIVHDEKPFLFKMLSVRSTSARCRPLAARSIIAAFVSVVVMHYWMCLVGNRLWYCHLARLGSNVPPIKSTL